MHIKHLENYLPCSKCLGIFIHDYYYSWHHQEAGAAIPLLRWSTWGSKNPWCLLYSELQWKSFLSAEHEHPEFTGFSVSSELFYHLPLNTLLSGSVQGIILVSWGCMRKMSRCDLFSQVVDLSCAQWYGTVLSSNLATVIDVSGMFLNNNLRRCVLNSAVLELAQNPNKIWEIGVGGEDGVSEWCISQDS